MALNPVFSYQLFLAMFSGLISLTKISSVMAKHFLMFLILAGFFQQAESQKNGNLISRIAFGSCAEETAPQPILDLVVKHKPELFV